jgi:hypothetical protein
VNTVHTRANKSGNVPVAGDFAWWDLLHGAVDCVEEGLGFVGASHGCEPTLPTDACRSMGKRSQSAGG